MIGKVTFEIEGKPAVVTLEDGGAVTCDDEDAKGIFETMLDRHRENYSPSQGPFGTLLLHDFAQLVAGKVEMEKKAAPKNDDGSPIVY